jgi:L,D-transpeptidase YcbB
VDLVYFADVKTLIPLCLLLLTACFHANKQAQKHEFTEPILIDESFIRSQSLTCNASVNYFYQLTKNELSWTDSSGYTTDAVMLISLIEQIDEYGLAPQHYYRDWFKSVPDSLLTHNARKTADIFLTDTYLSLYRHLHSGRLSADLLEKIVLDSLVDSVAVQSLVKVIASHAVHDTLLARQPSTFQYTSLRDTLQHLIRTAANDSAAVAQQRLLNINLERLRLNKDKPTRYLSVNIPAFMMSIIEDDSAVFESRVIVGKPESSTPQLSSIIKSFVIYPYWNVPRGIATTEILPLIIADSTYLDTHNFDVLDRSNNVVDHRTIDWKSLNENNFPYLLRQREGRENSLGIIKFVFNNRYRVYLHDTNGRGLFKKDKRALSHGCVRVQKAIELAHYLLKEDSVYITPDDLDQYLSLKERLEIRVMNPLPVYLEYYTCEVRGGRIKYYPDIYNQDAAIEEKLNADVASEVSL